MTLHAAVNALLLVVVVAGCGGAPHPIGRSPDARTDGRVPVAPGRLTSPAPVVAAVPPDAAEPPPSGVVPCPARRADLAGLRAPLDGPAVPPIERDAALAPFFAALARLDRGLATDHVRVAVYGDSNLTMDYPTGRLRRVLSAAFGEGGHGFVAAGQPWSHYQHRDVRHGVVSGWKVYAITTAPTGDGFYGLGGIAVENEWQGATTFVQTALPGTPVGTRAARFDVFYLRRRGGGRFDIEVDGLATARVETATDHDEPQPVRRLGLERVEVEEGEHRLDLISSSGGLTRLFGVALERRAPGIVIDTFGVGALNSRAQAKADRSLSIEMLRARRYDLIVFMTGANDVFTMDAVPEAFDSLLAVQREALPGVPILVVSPTDRGAKRSFPKTIEVVEQRRHLAERQGLPYWSLWEAMGGRDAMSRFLRQGLARRDAIHWNEAGGDWAGDRLAHALVRSYEQHLDADPRAGCEPGQEPASRSSLASAPARE
jgi:lysophospholipase L1-like esterase